MQEIVPGRILAHKFRADCVSQRYQTSTNEQQEENCKRRLWWRWIRWVKVQDKCVNKIEEILPDETEVGYSWTWYIEVDIANRITILRTGLQASGVKAALPKDIRNSTLWESQRCLLVPHTRNNPKQLSQDF